MMSYTVHLQCLAFDTATLHPGVRSLNFFHDRDGVTSDDTALDEKLLVDWLFDEPRARAMVFRALALPLDAKHSLRVTQPFIRGTDGKPGDIDVLACGRDAPHKAIVLECKRVRVRAGDAAGQRVNRLEEVGYHAPGQVNGLCKLGFHRVYLAVIAIVHDLSDMEYNFVFRGLREATFSRLVRFVDDLRLHDRAGILYIEIAQPLSASIHESAVISVGVLKPAASREQTHDLTMRVQQYFSPEAKG